MYTVQGDHLEVNLKQIIGLNRGCGGYSCAAIIRKNDIFNFTKDYFQWMAASLILLQAYALKNDYARILHSSIFRKTQSPSCHLRRRKFQSYFFTWWKCLNKPKKVGWRIHLVSVKLQQRGIVVTDGRRSSWRHLRRHPTEISVFGPRMEAKKKTIMLGEIWRSPGSCHESMRVTKTPLPGCPKKIQVWLPKNLAEHTRPDIWLETFGTLYHTFFFIKNAR